MDITISNVITIHNPSQQIKDYCRNELVINNPEYEKKQRLGFWVGETPQKIWLYSKKGNDYILPYGTLGEIRKFIEPDDTYKADFPLIQHIDYNCDIPLYGYQLTAVMNMMFEQHGILKAPAGSGKTQMGIAIIGKYNERALWITHTQDLLKQSYNRAKQYIDENMLGTITEGKINIGTGITFATIQTLSRIDLSEYSDYWDVIIVDECHRCSGSPTVMTQFSKVLNQLTARHKFGLSATVHRADGTIKCTYSLLGGIKYTVPDEAVGNRIVRVGIKPIGTGVGVTLDCLNEDGTLNYTGMISALADNRNRSLKIVDEIIKEKDKSCLILSERVSHLDMLFNLLPPDMQQDAVVITGKMQSKSAKAVREQAIQDMRDGKKKYMFATYSLAKEGLDIPRLERLFMATPVKDYAVVTQSIGRVARQYEGKADPICYDFVDNIPYLLKAYKKRWYSYKKINCYEVKDDKGY